MRFEKDMIFENDFINIFIKAVVGEKVKFIEGYSPAAIHDMQELAAADLERHIKEYGFKMKIECF